MKRHWLYQRKNHSKLWLIGAVALTVTLATEFFIHLHGYFSVVKFFGFNALFGFLSCVAMVVFAKVFGFIVKRKDDYYDL